VFTKNLSIFLARFQIVTDFSSKLIPQIWSLVTLGDTLVWFLLISKMEDIEAITERLPPKGNRKVPSSMQRFRELGGGWGVDSGSLRLKLNYCNGFEMFLFSLAQPFCVLEAPLNEVVHTIYYLSRKSMHQGTSIYYDHSRTTNPDDIDTHWAARIFYWKTQHWTTNAQIGPINRQRMFRWDVLIY
jgi:hypothetical protein